MNNNSQDNTSAFQNLMEADKGKDGNELKERENLVQESVMNTHESLADPNQQSHHQIPAHDQIENENAGMMGTQVLNN